jgi:hypothetical protein
VLVLASSFLAPSMACAFPTSQMTASEHACCRRMNGDCGSMKMPVSHSCCQRGVEASHLDAVQPAAASLHFTIAFTAILPPSACYQVFAPTFRPVAQPDPSPPRSPGPAISILRI